VQALAGARRGRGGRTITGDLGGVRRPTQAAADSPRQTRDASTRLGASTRGRVGAGRQIEASGRKVTPNLNMSIRLATSESSLPRALLLTTPLAGRWQAMQDAGP
jgi:hypothetical protein